MKRTALLIGLVWLSACSFPEFKVEGDGGTSGNGGTPAESPCEDRERTGAETGVDCGIVACGVVCQVGQGCDTHNDCNGGACLTGICQAESCADELENALESDVDCGGNSGCRRCTVDERCHDVTDCDGGLCSTGLCRAATCKDGLQNGKETDSDCGGADCPACDEGQSCIESEDCDNVACVKGKCQPRGCSDGVKNQNETDLDCGGSCPSPCDTGLRCKLAEDCASAVCAPQTLRCVAPECDDGVLNGSEPTLDCGAGCPKKCAVLDECSVAEDCASSSCASDVCVPSAATDELLPMLGWVATASHMAIGSSPPQRAIDGSLSTDWITGANQMAGMWFTVDMQQRQVFYSVELLIDDGNNALDAPDMVDVSLSDDGTFVTRAIKNRPGAQRLRIDFTEPQVARYIRISLSPGVATNRWWRIDELRVRQ